MTRTQAAFAALGWALALPAWLPGPAAAQKPPPRSALGMDPAQVEYLSNAAPFVVFDIAPRQLDLRHGGSAGMVLNFVATDALRQVKVFASPRQGSPSPPSGAIPAQAPVYVPTSATACNAQVAGYYSCAIRIADALTWLDGHDGQLALRIEAEGLDRDRSVVQITLPVLGTGARPARNDAIPARTLTLLSTAAAQ